MITITKQIEFDAGHRVPSHNGKCRNPHGHRYRVEVEVSGTIPDDGMVLDYGILKSVMMTEIHDVFDHSMIVWEHDTDLQEALAGKGWNVVTVTNPPTAEHLAVLFRDILVDVLAPIRVVAVTVWETPTSTARACHEGQ